MRAATRRAVQRVATPARGIRNDAQFKSRDANTTDWYSDQLRSVFGGFGSFRSPPLSAGVVGVGVTALGGLYVAKKALLFTEAGVTYVVTDKITGKLSVYTNPGMHYKKPFFSDVTEYKQVISTKFEDSQDKAGSKSFYNDEPHSALDSVQVRFADTYVGRIPVSFRFAMPLNEDKMVMLHKEFRSQRNLQDALLNRNARNVTVITATQYTGEEFFQGGLNQFKNQLSDQLNGGVYETQRKQVEVEATELAPVGSDQEDSRKLTKQKNLVWKTVQQYDDKGAPRRGENPLARYGVAVTQVLLSDPRPETSLERLLVDKKRLVADRIKAVQEQETAKAQAQTEQMKKQIQKTKEVQDAQRIKELGIIDEQRKVEVAKKIAEKEVIESKKRAELSTIDKEKELAIAQANYNIQKANSDASIYEAKAIEAKGKAEAKVLAAMYKAKAQNKAVFIAEIERDIAKSIYSNLKDFKIQMPQNYIGGGDASGKVTSNLDVITGFAALGLMDKSAGKKS